MVASLVEIVISSTNQCTKGFGFVEHGKASGDGCVSADAELHIDEFEAPGHFFDIQPGQSAQEFISPVADNEVIGPNVFPNCVSHQYEEFISRTVAVTVIDRLQSININEGEGEYLIGSRRPNEFTLQLKEAS
jgi:hypothetical protein